jgi:hypothetical protein
VRAHVVPAALQERQRLARQPLAVPGVGQAARHAPDLRAADGQAVVVELLAEPQVRRAGG